MFEPFYPQKVPQCRFFRYRQYLRPSDKDPKYVAVAEAILTGRIRNRWIDAHNKRFIADSRIIKDIRANLLLGWLHTNFPDLRIIVLFRHPCAVARSKLKLGWGTHLDEFLAQPELMADHLNKFESLLRSAETDFEKHILLWCVEHYVPLRQFAPGEIYFAFYERLCAQPEAEFKKIFDFLGLESSTADTNILGRPSAMSQKSSAIFSGESLIDTWRKEISREQVQRAIEILSAFGLAHIYTDDLMPLSDSPILNPAGSGHR
jgi:hypothetical protein